MADIENQTAVVLLSAHISMESESSPGGGNYLEILEQVSRILSLSVYIK